ncbi:MAG: M56 family metallopeptidase, partial [Isosphaeraceae bacterium]
MAELMTNAAGGLIPMLAAIAWQSSALLALGLAASLWLGRRPARAHRILLLAMAAAVVAPIAARVVRIEGWGLWTSSATARAGSDRPGDGSADLMAAAPSPMTGPAAAPLLRPTPAAMPAVRTLRSATSPEPERPATGIRVSAAALVGWTWAGLGLLFFARLAAATVAARRVIREAEPIADDAWQRAAEIAARRLGLPETPEVRTSASVRCPSIWCWGRRPVILLPADETCARATVDWVGVFSHELAHRVRRDHWSGLFAEMLVVVLPWHPLAWAARRRLGQLSELACDDWALAAGVSAEDYAESLLGLVPRREASIVLAAVSSRRGLIGRVRHILDDRRIVPAVGRAWGLASAAVVALAVSAVALAQARPSNATATDEARPAASRPDAAGRDTPRHAAHGRVLGPDGAPVSGAEILWLAHPVRPSAGRSGDPAMGDRPPSTLAKSRTDADGRYSIAASFRPSEFEAAYLVVTAQGLGLQTHYLDTAFQQPDDARALDEVVDFGLSSTAMIRGRLLMPSGRPAAGARVRLDQFQYHDASRQGWSASRTAADDDLPAFWPKPARADADGRFALEGVPESASAFLTIAHPECALEELLVNTARDGAVNPRLSDYEPRPLGTNFTHTLGPARPVEGRITDRAPGRPGGGARVELSALGGPGGRAVRS